MIDSARNVGAGEVLRSDVCIVGAGPAGIAVAQALADTPLEVILLESGGEEPDPEVQALNRGEVVGAPQFPLHTSRLRGLGGTCNHWEGMCRPLDPLDFEERPWVPHSGWPIGRDDLEPYYRRAHEICDLGPLDYGPQSWGAHARSSPALEAQGVVAKLAQFSKPTRFGDKYRERLHTAPRIRLLLDATVLQLVPDGSARRIERVEVATLDGRRFDVASRLVVVACGGIENARLLLLSNRVVPEGVGNHHDRVGRFFMDHPAARPMGALLLLDDSLELLRSRPQAGETKGRVGLGLEPAVQHREGLLNGAVYASPLQPLRRLKADARFDVGYFFRDPDERTAAFLHRLAGRPGDPRFAALWLRSEQAPNPDSRVTLAAERDALGQRRARVEWRFSEVDAHHVRRASGLFAEAIARAGHGRVRTIPWLLMQNEDWWEGETPIWWRFMFAGFHHMGTTRMATSAERGVVDPSCRVFGIDNLYVAGSSVFPTSGYINPTLTLVALALRLADHLAAHPA